MWRRMWLREEVVEVEDEAVDEVDPGEDLLHDAKFFVGVELFISGSIRHFYKRCCYVPYIFFLPAQYIHVFL